MKWQDIREDGRIVKGVNTTVDVDTNQIPKEAGKFGNKVDKDGVPPTLSKKVKGKSTNVLFNLGLAEGKYADIHDVKDFNPDNLEIWVKGVGVYTLNGLKNRLKQRLESFADNMDYNAEGVENILNGKGYDAFMSMLRGYNEVMAALETPQMKRKKTIAKRKAQYSEGHAIPNPKNTFLAKSDTAYDHYKIGTNLANLKTVPKGANYDEPDVVIAPYAGEKETKYLMKQLARIGYDVQDAEGYQDAHFDDKPTGGEAPPQIKDQGKLGKIKLNKLRSVQKGRNFRKLEKQLSRVKDGNYSPLTIDPRGRIVNGHHRFDALRLMGEEFATVRMIDTSLEEMIAENFVKPQLDVEWDEAERYPEFRKIGKQAWIELAKKGKEITITDASDINNTDAADINSFKSLDKNKQKRALAQLEKGSVEMPIVAVYSDGYKELIGGNTRLTAMMAKDGKATVWQFEVPDEVAELAENFADGTLYHATYKPLLKSIQANGLGGGGAQTKWTDSKPGVVYLAKDPDVAVSYAETSDEVPEEWLDQIVVLAISTDSLDTSKLKDDENVLDDDITLEYHGVIKKFKLGENFADGKKKGKSRPGRVKRSGASCNGSVTALRKRAKKASGEKARMYHWCANMKSGKKKK